MKICWWTVYPTVNQTAIIGALRDRGVDVVACYFGQYDHYRLSMGWVPPPLRPWEFQVSDLTSARRRIPDFDERIQMVPSFADRLSWCLVLYCVRHRIPWFSVTEGSSGSWKTWLIRKFFAKCVNRWALRLFCMGARAEEQFARLGVSRDKIRPFAYAIPPPPASVIQAERGEGCRFVYAGALSNRKAVDILAASWRQVSQAVPSASLRVIGDGPLRHLFADLPHVEMVGAVRPESVYEAMAGGDVIVLPSRYDAWGVALCEGACCGMAMIASDRVGSSGLVVPGENGVVVPAGNADALTSAMLDEARNPDQARRRGRSAQATMHQSVEPALLAGRLARALSERLVPDFWEEHCTECGEPACYMTCPNFERAPHGRCRRFAQGIERLEGGGLAVTFKPWGKLELLFHGRLATVETVRSIRAANDVAEPRAECLTSSFPGRLMPYARNPYGIYRSLRWRKAMRRAECCGRPEIWRVEAVSQKTERLVFEIRNAALDVLFSRTLEVTPEGGAWTMPVPYVAPGALFSVRPLDGAATGRIAFRRLELAVAPPPAPFVKCVAWDLDGVLWKGTLVEGDRGEVNAEVVDVIRRLDARGVLNSICSRNDEASAMDALRQLGLEEYFVFPQIGWGAKSASLDHLAEELNIGLDTLAFVDDREENRREVGERLPQIRVFTEADVVGMAALACFNPPQSSESATRRTFYRDEMRRREALRTEADGHEPFLHAEIVSYECVPVEGERVARCRELVQRTNQLNLTARRYGEDAFARLLESAECRAVRAWDRFGDYGVVGFVALRGRHLVECCFSCRVAKKGVERRVLSEIAAGGKLTADVVVTERNGPIRRIVEEFL